MPTSTTDGTTTRVSLPRPHAGQRSILDDARRFNVVNCGRRFGKTVLGINLACEAALPDGDRPGRPVGWFAPEYKLLREAWRDLNTLLAPVIASSNSQERRIELVNGGIIEAWSFDRNPNAGRSRKYKRIIIDEAAHCDNLQSVWTKAVRPTLTDFKGDAWFLSSPNGKNFFYTLWQRGLSPAGSWKSWRRTSYDNPHLDPGEIDSAKADLGEKFFGQEYLAEFLDDLLATLIPDDWLDRAAASRHFRNGPARMTIDLAEGGGDPAGVLVLDDNGAIEGATGQWNLEQTATKAALLAQRHRIAGGRVVYDQTGIGSDFANRLDAVGLKGSVGYKGGSSGGSGFANLRSAAAWVLRQRLDPGQLGPNNVAPPAFAVPPAIMDQARGDLQALRYTIKNDRRKALEPKEELVAALGRSPTWADLFIMAFSRAGM